MKALNEYLQLNEAEFCKPNDLCYKVLNKEGNQICCYIPYTGFGEGDELKKQAEAMAKEHDGKIVELQFKDLNNK